MSEIFTDDWARQWCRGVQDSEAYRRAAAGWEGAIVVVMSADPAMGVPRSRAVYLDLTDGDCRSGRKADPDDHEDAVFELRATPAVWKRVLAGEMEPIWGLMSGKIELARGSISKLIPYARAAKELVAAAAALPATFPAGWNGSAGGDDAAAGRRG
jgi:putative sterol carrier protein